MKFSDFLDKQTLNEEALSKLAGALKNNDYAFCVLTASRGENSPEKDKKDNEELRKLARKMLFGYRRVLGHYIEKDEAGNEYDHADDSILITCHAKDALKLLEFGKQMMNRYKQESILFKFPNGEVQLIKRDKTVQKLGDFHPNSLANYMSTFKNGRSFVFDILENNLSVRYDNHLHAMRCEASRNKALREKLFETCETPECLDFDPI